MRPVLFMISMIALVAPVAADAKVPAQARAQSQLARALEGRTAGEPVDCLNLRDINSTEIIDGTAILYRTGANRLYVNYPASGANWLDDDDILVTHTYSSELCSIDTVRLVDRASQFPRGSVGLGKFVPYVKLARPAH